MHAHCGEKREKEFRAVWQDNRHDITRPDPESAEAGRQPS
jgi:hypothetical protein